MQSLRAFERLPQHVPWHARPYQAALFLSGLISRLRIVDAEEGRILNRDYRGKDYATNVLTFAYTEDMLCEVTQADIILSHGRLEKSQRNKRKPC